jgi:hypothetical protein
MSEEQLPVEPFVPSAELLAAVQSAITDIMDRPYSERKPELGKMIKCQVCQHRHRAHIKCEQKFTYRIGDYENFREDEGGNLVPDYRTAVHPDESPTKRQVVGAAQFKGKRIKPHPSKMKLLFIERTREVFDRNGYGLETTGEEFDKNLQQARVIAAREIRKDRRDRRYAARYIQDVSRRVNRGLLT